jgi:acyl-CoA dehydrogenase
VFPWGKTFNAPDDLLGHRVSRLLMEDSPARDRLTAGMFINRHQADPVGRLELALAQVAAAEEIEAKVRAAAKSGAVHGFTTGERIAAAVRIGAISAQDAATVDRYNELRRACIMVDDFPLEIGRHATSEPVKITDFQDALMARKTA